MTRLIDKDGYVIKCPAEYYEADEQIKKLIEAMDADGVDRSDMIVILSNLFRDANFRITFLPRR
jgi:hypothetical protein